MNLNSLILYAGFCAPLMPIIFGALRKDRLSVIQKILFRMTVIIFINQAISVAWTHWMKQPNNLPFFHVYIFLESIFLTLIFQRLMQSSRFRFVSSGILGIFSLCALFLFFTGNHMWEYPDYMRFAESIIIVGYGCTYFVKVFRESRIIHLSKDQGFWISAGLILYFSGNALLFLFSQFVLQLSDEAFSLIWSVHSVLVILLYLSFTFAIRCRENHNLS